MLSIRQCFISFEFFRWKEDFLLIFDSRKGDEGKDRIEKCNVKGVKNCVPCIKEYPLICDNDNLYKYVI